MLDFPQIQDHATPDESDSNWRTKKQLKTQHDSAIDWHVHNCIKALKYRGLMFISWCIF